MENQIKLRKYRRFKYICLLERNEATKESIFVLGRFLRMVVMHLSF